VIALLQRREHETQGGDGTLVAALGGILEGRM
jgi:hypothetical protein